jgi:hypothetical protein
VSTDLNEFWEEDALCQEYDSSLFILSENPIDHEKNKSNFEIAEAICSQCPVLVECWHAAKPIDKRVTMRAGAWPEDYSEGPPRIKVDGRCANNHDTTPSGSRNAQGKCKQCIREKATRYRERQKGVVD